ncbi:MAG TPA: FAD binding domain-containing protein [Trebonia sp.]|nr:FAD binding domain-containing protein [Trebonia sp.]
MDLNTVTSQVAAPGAGWRAGDAYLAGGTWLFSEPQPGTTRLLDLAAYGWPPLTETGAGLEIAATCTLAELARWRPRRDWPAAMALPRQCADALLGSFKVHNAATVGGNICLALPAGPMIALGAALEGVATIWPPDGAPRRVRVADLVSGEHQTVLRPGDLLRSVFLPAPALASRAACRQVSLSPVGRSAVLLIGTCGPDETLLTLTAAVPRPVQVRLPALPLYHGLGASGDAACAVASERGQAGGAGEAAARALDEAVRASTGYLDDVHGSAPWRRAMTRLAVAEVMAELSAPGSQP